ncbi:MAG TPA: DUF2877 domain-containing protein [Roseiarcus sp.]|nr:DUF2877 domain-containing protein [Roseiarcus sp.]
MMRVAALSIGYGAPTGDFDGRVEAAYPRACVLLLDDHGLLTLVTPTIGRLPRGVVVDAPPEFAFAPGVAIGAAAAARSGILRIRGAALAVDLRAAPLWRSPLGFLKIDGMRDAVARALETAGAALRQDGRSDLFMRLAGARLAALGAATRALDAPTAEKAMSGLVGLGDGLTPAGDDYLIGYFAGLWACAGAEPLRMNFVAALGQWLKQAARDAGRISRVYLEAIANGETSERLFDLASAVAAGSDHAAVDRAVTAALAVGHSSGACGVLGFLQACASWSNETPIEGSSVKYSKSHYR